MALTKADFRSKDRLAEFILCCFVLPAGSRFPLPSTHTRWRVFLSSRPPRRGDGLAIWRPKWLPGSLGTGTTCATTLRNAAGKNVRRPRCQLAKSTGSQLTRSEASAQTRRSFNRHWNKQVRAGPLFTFFEISATRCHSHEYQNC